MISNIACQRVNLLCYPSFYFFPGKVLIPVSEIWEAVTKALWEGLGSLLYLFLLCLALPPTSCQSQNVTYLLLTPLYFLPKMSNLFTYIISSATTSILSPTMYHWDHCSSFLHVLLDISHSCSSSYHHHSTFRRTFLNSKPHYVTALLKTLSVSS